MKASLYFRNLLFTILQPGIVTGLIPYIILRWNHRPLPTITLNIFEWVSMIMFGSGLIILVSCIYHFIEYGKGTLSPLDPTQQLVTNGFYKYSRNPMYIGVMLILFAEVLFFKSIELGLYSVLIFTLFNAFIKIHEEPRLHRIFGQSYAIYQNKVRRWL